jgi:acetylornithine aminotransferase
MRAGVITIEAMESEGLLENAADVGGFIIDSLKVAFAHHPGVIEVRGQGLMIGIELDRPCGDLVGRALEAGVVLNVTADKVIRLLPPLIFRREHARQLLDVLTPLIRAKLDTPAAG